MNQYDTTRVIEGLARVEEKVSSISAEVKELKSDVARNFVTHEEFAPVRAIVYGMVALVLVSVMGAILILVVKK